MSKIIKYYYDLMSPPSRAMLILFKLNKTPFEDKPVALRKAEHHSKQFKEVNRFQKLPCIDDNGFKLSESIAILRYLHSKKQISDDWYPSEVKPRALVDEYLEWQHNTVRAGCGMYFITKWRTPLLTGKEPDPKELRFIKKHMEDSLNVVENIWLESNNFIAGNQISVADLFAACEIQQSTLAGYDPCENRPKLKVWLDKVRETTNPFYDEANKFIYKKSQNSSKL